MSPLTSILYICDACRKIRQFDVSKNELKLEGEITKIRDMHANHEAIIYINHNTIEKVIFNPPVPLLEEPIIKGPALVEEVPIGPFKEANRIFIPTIDPKQIPVQIELHKLIVLNMNGVNTLGDLYEGLSPDWPELTPEYLLSLIHKLEVRGWIREKEAEERTKKE